MSLCYDPQSGYFCDYTKPKDASFIWIEIFQINTQEVSEMS